MKIQYIIDPTAFNGLYSSIENSLRAKLHELAIEGETTKIIGKNDTEKVTRLALERKFDAVVVIGSDHTLREVSYSLIDWMTSKDESIALGYIPLDTQRSPLAQTLGFESWAHATEVIAQKNTRTIPVGFIDNSILLHETVAISASEYNHNQDITPVTRSQRLLGLLKSLFETTSHGQFEYSLSTEDGQEIKGQATKIFFYNDRFLDRANAAVIRIVVHNTPQVSGSFRADISNNTLSQFFARSLTIELSTPCVFSLNGDTLERSKAHIGISDVEVEFLAP